MHHISALHTKCLSLFFTSLFLFACGSESGGEDIQLRSQAPLTFAQSAVEILIFDEPTANPLSGGSGSGDITYTSSNSQVVDVDAATGSITINGAGSATVTAIKAADNTYSSAQASYTITVLKAEQGDLSFQLGSLSVYIDQMPEQNPVSGGSGTGALVYASEDESVASVNPESGSVAVHSVGTVVITVTRQEDSHYLPAMAHYSLTVQKYQQDELVFEFLSLQGAIGTVAPDNPLTGGSGQGQISYESSDSDVASVDPLTGEVSPLTPGTAVITAHKAEDDMFLGASASYEVEAYEVVGGLMISLGHESTEVEWKAQDGSVEVIRYQYQGCNVDTYQGCPNSHLRTISQPQHTPFTDGYPTLSQSAYMVIQNSEKRSRPIHLVAPEVSFKGRAGHALASYKHRLWIFGGRYSNENASDTYLSDVWSSADGVNWVLETEEANFRRRARHQVMEFDGKLYLFSGEQGLEGGGIFGAFDVWISDNGVDWEELSVSASAQRGFGGNVVEFNNRLWNVTYEVFNHDSVVVWSSADGAYWQLELDDPPFAPRSGGILYTDSEYLYLMGGEFGSYPDVTVYRDVWRSSDGVHWEQVTTDGGYTLTFRAQIQFRDGQFLLATGVPHWSSPHWYTSTDGIHWNKTDVDFPSLFGSPESVSITEHKDALWLVSGEGLFVPSNHVWRSRDGLIWRMPVDVSDLQWEARE